MKKRPQLTSLSIKFLEVKDKMYEVPDIPGLFLRVYPSGKLVWKINKSVNGKRVVKTLGDYPTVSIAKARQQVTALNLDEQTNTGNTFKDVFENWLECRKLKNKEWTRIASRDKKRLLPTLGSIPWNDITPMMVINTIKTHVPPTLRAEYYFGDIASMERFALTLGITTTLKFQTLASLLPKRPKAHQPTIPAQDLPIFFNELKTLMSLPRKVPRNIVVIKLMFLTLLRTRELCLLKWSYIDTDTKVITIPSEIMKMRRPHTVPITRQIQETLDSLPKESDYVFSPTLDKTGDAKALKMTICNIFKQIVTNGNRLVPHGIRAMGRTWMAEQGIDFEVAENCLAHTVGNSVVQAYSRTTLLERRRVAMQKWDDFVEECFNK